MKEMIYAATFWGAIGFTTIGALLGLAGVWIKGFWQSETAPKLIITNVILAGTAVIVAAITKWLG